MSAPESLAADLARIVRSAQSENRLPSVSAAAFRAGEIIWSEAVGLADVESGTEATPDCQYRIASITKTFTAVVILQLRDAGRLDLDDPLDRHIPGAAHAPKLRGLLTHLSGIQREVPGRVWETLQMPTREEVVATLGEAEQILPPDQAWHYSNLAYALLGEVVARTSGQAYESYVDERILRPLGLARTTWRPDPPVATGYFVEPYFNGVRTEPVVEGRGTVAAGELWSTTRDLCRWGAFLSNPDSAVLAPETAEEMRSFQAMADPEHWTVGWGLGPMLYRQDERIFVGHDGGHLGFLSHFSFEPKTKTGAAVLTNAGSGITISELGVQLAASVAEAFPAEPDLWRPAESPPPELEGVLGRWWSEASEFVFSYRAGRLEARLPGARPPNEVAIFEREGPDRFRSAVGRERGELLRIVRDDRGEVVKLYWATYPFTRTPQPLGG